MLKSQMPDDGMAQEPKENTRLLQINLLHLRHFPQPCRDGIAAIDARCAFGGHHF